MSRPPKHLSAAKQVSIGRDAHGSDAGASALSRGSLELGVAWRYFRSRRHNSFVSFIALVSLVGIMLGIAALIVVVSVMNGFGNDLRERILGSSTHVIITPLLQNLPDAKEISSAPLTPKLTPKLTSQQLNTLLSDYDGAYSLAPYVKGVGMLANKDSLAGVNLHGVEPVLENAVTHLSERMLIGRADNLSIGSDQLLIGDRLAIELGVSLYDQVTLILPQSQAQSADLTPKLRRFKIGGIFRFDHPEINRRDVYMHRVDLLRLQALSDDTQGYRLRLSDPFVATDISALLQADPALDGYAVTDWTKEQASIFKAVKMEKTVMFILLLLIVAVAAFNIVSTLMMVVKDKRHDIAVFRTLGMTPRSVTKIFFTQGMFIGGIGSVLGVMLGVLITLNINTIMPLLETTFGFSLFPKDLMLVQGLPYELQIENIVFTFVVALVLTALAAIYPARKAALVEPGEALRYD